MKAHVPKKGDFIAVTFDPQSGHEQKRRRPALVVSNTLFNFPDFSRRWEKLLRPLHFLPYRLPFLFSQFNLTLAISGVCQFLVETFVAPISLSFLYAATDTASPSTRSMVPTTPAI
ncbi:MAG: type II toxin-antitoxin system PemK/MazF family toxin [Syntrophorhabdales bacterium]|jgi:hypothetical protein